MKLNNLFNNRKEPKVSIYSHETSYRIIVYSSNLGEERVWNGTNFPPPEYIINDIFGRLFYCGSVGDRLPLYEPQKGERYFTYKTPEKWVKSRRLICKIYWDRNFQDIKKRYETFEEFFAISCSSMNKKRLDLKEA